MSSLSSLMLLPGRVTVERRVLAAAGPGDAVTERRGADFFLDMSEVITG